MPSKLSGPPTAAAGKADAQDYFIDMIEQLAAMARDLAEPEVALHLLATAEARRLALQRRPRESARMSPRRAD